jgi:hypothetical protein
MRGIAVQFSVCVVERGSISLHSSAIGPIYAKQFVQLQIRRYDEV